MDRIRLRYRPPAGFTLIELLLYVVLAGTLLLALSSFFGLAMTARVKNQSISEVDQQGQFAMEMVGRSVRQATAVQSPTAGNTAASISVTPSSGPSPTVFDVSGGVLRVTEGGGSSVALTNRRVRVVSFSVENLSRSGTPGVARIVLELTTANTSNREEWKYQKTFTTSMSLRRSL